MRFGSRNDDNTWRLIVHFIATFSLLLVVDVVDVEDNYCSEGGGGALLTVSCGVYMTCEWMRKSKK